MTQLARHDTRASKVLRMPSPSAALLPVHKRALGVAVGVVFGIGIFALTAFHVLFRPPGALNIGLLAEYFYRYEVSWRGAFVGLFWGFATGFIAGWFVAFVRNFAVAIRVIVLRRKAELAQVQDFLDLI